MIIGIVSTSITSRCCISTTLSDVVRFETPQALLARQVVAWVPISLSSISSVSKYWNKNDIQLVLLIKWIFVT
jgi:hypothetical protein